MWDFPEVKVDDEVILCKLEVGRRVKLNLKFNSMPVHQNDFVPNRCHTPISSEFVITY